MKTDSLFYRLFQSDPGLALELAGLEVPEPARYRFGSKEIKQTTFRLDGVLEPPADCPHAPVAFAEVQFQPDEGFNLRFLSEILLYLRQYAPTSAWLAVVFYSTASIERAASAHASLLDLPNLRRIYLDQLPLHSSLNPKHWLVALILADTSNLRGLVDQVRAHQAQASDQIDWLDLLETILVYKLPELTREEIQAMFGYNDIELKQTRFYQQAFGEGRVEGCVEGRVEGRVEGEASLLLRLLERRFGALPEAVRQRVAAADAETLLIWGERVLDARTLEEIWSE
ncbi:MAG: Rpn family recombination-promoting nuclease/putative transposase [Methylococcales bacterium]